MGLVVSQDTVRVPGVSLVSVRPVMGLEGAERPVIGVRRRSEDVHDGHHGRLVCPLFLVWLVAYFMFIPLLHRRGQCFSLFGVRALLCWYGSWVCGVPVPSSSQRGRELRRQGWLTPLEIEEAGGNRPAASRRTVRVAAPPPLLVPMMGRDGLHGHSRPWGVVLKSEVETQLAPELMALHVLLLGQRFRRVVFR